MAISIGVIYLIYQQYQFKIMLRNATQHLESSLDEDELYDEAKRQVIEVGKASTSYLQRSLRIGYSRAANLIDLLESNGVISKADGIKPRTIINDQI